VEALWYKGNLHTHTLNSDGDSTPDAVVTWYRERGYHFLVLTDHHYLTSVTGLNALHGADDKFLVVKGEEVTDRFGDKPIHINGLDVDRLIQPPGGKSIVDMVQRMVDAIRDARGVPGLEETWDRILSSGKMLYGIAVDDAHSFKRPDDPTVPRPGTGWVYVRSARLEPRAWSRRSSAETSTRPPASSFGRSSRLRPVSLSR